MAPRLRDKGGVVRTSRLLLWLAALSAVACCGRAMQGFVRRRRVDFSQIPKTARIQLYYESLCPYSVAFITEQLWPTYVRVGYLMDVQLVPFGNAFKEQQQEKPNSSRAERFAVGRRQEPDYKYSCQHGPDECFGNVVQSCAAHIFNDTILSLAFVTCMSLAERPHEAGRECARGIARNWNAIQRCANGGKGRVLQDEMGERTWNLDPPHHYVPWIVINGVHNDEQQAMAQTDLLQVVGCTSVERLSAKPPNAPTRTRVEGFQLCVIFLPVSS
ncbi:gamma-interferon-inducible lysosomal thiol reductase isoform X3 [Rhipicephalus microplus]|uniref:gamma-interferon-inducible lysosomal thiol reductase isoform X3 n=1 Tax=Rhipicephalus microplus TaxID=6941 RepID=UPI003F6B26F4